MRYFLLILLLCLNSCLGYRLQVQTQYLDQENLASYQVGTPDPNLDCPKIGQRLLIQWKLHKCFAKQPLWLHIQVRFFNRQIDDLKIPLDEKSGTYLYDVINEQYRITRGILTYKVDIYADEEIIDSWQHPLWANLINFAQ